MVQQRARLPLRIAEAQLDSACAGRRAAHAVDSQHVERIGRRQRRRGNLVVLAIQPDEFHFANMKQAKDARQSNASVYSIGPQALVRAARPCNIDDGTGAADDVPVEIQTLCFARGHRAQRPQDFRLYMEQIQLAEIQTAHDLTVTGGPAFNRRTPVRVTIARKYGKHWQKA